MSTCATLKPRDLVLFNRICGELGKRANRIIEIRTRRMRVTRCREKIILLRGRRFRCTRACTRIFFVDKVRAVTHSPSRELFSCHAGAAVISSCVHVRSTSASASTFVLAAAANAEGACSERRDAFQACAICKTSCHVGARHARSCSK